MNDLKNKSIKCIMTQEDYQKELDKKGIKNFFQVKLKQEKPEQQKPPP